MFWASVGCCHQVQGQSVPSAMGGVAWKGENMLAFIHLLQLNFDAHLGSALHTFCYRQRPNGGGQGDVEASKAVNLEVPL